MFLKPVHILPHLHVAPHMEVALFEARNSFFALPILETLSNGGKLYCLGSNDELLQKIFNEVKHLKSSFHVLKAHVGKKKGVPLKDSLLDIVLLDNVFFSFENKEELIEEIMRVLKKGGRALVIDWHGSFNGIGPHKDHVVSKQETEHFFSKFNFSLLNDIDAGTFHYALLFRKM